MPVKYAKDQPAGFTNRIERVAVVGASGNVGKPITEFLLKTGKHTVTALTRVGSTSVLPEGVKVAKIDYSDESTIVAALREARTQFLVITLKAQIPPETQSILIRAAAAAGVPYVMPNNYGADYSNNEQLAKDIMLGVQVRETYALIEQLGVSSWISLVCGFWYETSVAMPKEWYGFDKENRVMTLYDDGKTRINTTTLAQCGRAVAALLSLKELPEDERDGGPTLQTWANRSLYVSSFRVNQLEMFESWKRVTGETDWKIERQPTEERYLQGLERLKGGELLGFGQMLYARLFYPNGDGDYEAKFGLANEALGLPVEDLDEATKLAKKMTDEGFVFAALKET